MKKFLKNEAECLASNLLSLKSKSCKEKIFWIDDIECIIKKEDIRLQICQDIAAINNFADENFWRYITEICKFLVKNVPDKITGRASTCPFGDEVDNTPCNAFTIKETERMARDRVNQKYYRHLTKTIAYFDTLIEKDLEDIDEALIAAARQYHHYCELNGQNNSKTIQAGKENFINECE